MYPISPEAVQNYPPIGSIIPVCLFERKQPTKQPRILRRETELSLQFTDLLEQFFTFSCQIF
jgi:hypothetical protein